MTKPTGLQYHLQNGNYWADITPWVLYSSNVEINRGRQDQFSTIQAGTLTATLDNSDGRFAPGTGYPLGTNYITNPAFTVDTTGWTASASLTVSPPVDTVTLTANSTAALTFQFTVTLPSSVVGQSFVLSTQLYGAGTVIGKTLTQKVEFYDGSNNLLVTRTRVSPQTIIAGWQTVATTGIIAPAGTVTAKVFPLYVPGGWAVNDNVQLDNVIYTDYTAGRYFDGRQITWSNGATYNTGSVPHDAFGFSQRSEWTGKADASTSLLYQTTPYYPALGADCPIRVRFPDPNNNNMVTSAEDASFEGGSVGTWLPYPGWGSIANSATRAWDGTKSLLLTSSAVHGGAYATIKPVTVGLTYTMQVRVWVPSGQPDVTLDLVGPVPGATAVTTSLKNQWATLTMTFTVPLSFASDTLLPIVAWATSTAGQQVWVDGFHFWEGTSAPPSFVTGPNPNYLYKYSGYLSSLPVGWPGGLNYSEMPITASDRLAQFGRRPLRSVVEEEILSDSPAVYYTLGEPAGATAAGDTSTNGNLPFKVAQRGTGGTVSFGTGTGPPTDGLTAVVFTPASSTNHKYLEVHYASPLSAFLDSKTIVCTINRPGHPTSDETLWRVWDASHWNTMNLNITSTGQLKLSWGTSGNLLSSLTVDGGFTHQVAVVFSGGSYPNITLTMYVDGVQTATTTSNQGLLLPAVSYIDLGGDPKFGTPFNGTMSHFAVFQSALTGARLSDESWAQATGFYNETVEQRAGRFMRWGGVAAADQSLEVGVQGSIDFLDTTGLQLYDALGKVAATEGGTIFIDRAGKAAFQARNHRWDVAPFVTLGPDDVGPDTKFILDQQLIVNQVTSSANAVANVVISDDASIAARGVYPVQLQLVSLTTADVTYAAQWVVNTSSIPRPRTDGILVDLLTSPQAVSDLFKTLEIGATFAVAGLPVQSPMYGANLVVEGWKEVISATEWSVLINTSVAIPIWKLEDPVYGAIDRSNRIAY